MDHLPQPEKPHDAVRIPFLGMFYDDGDFDTYLERQGTSLDEILQCADRISNPHSYDEESWLDKTLIEVRDQIASVMEHRHRDAREEFNDDSPGVMVQYIKSIVALQGLSAGTERDCGATFGRLLGDLYGPQSSTSAVHAAQGEDDFVSLKLGGLLARMSSFTKFCQRRGFWVRAQTVVDNVRIIVRIARLVYGPKTPGRLDTIQDSLHVCPIKTARSPFDLSRENDEAKYVMGKLQAWLFFGILREFLGCFGVPYQQNHFVEIDESGHWLTTKSLPLCLTQWNDKVEAQMESSDRDEATLSQQGMKLMSMLQKAASVAATFERVNPVSPLDESCHTFGILVLIYTLKAEVDRYFGGDVTENSSKFMRSKLLERGRCPNQVAAFESSLPLTWQYYMYTLSSPSNAQSGPLGHRLCSISDCKLNMVDEKTYKPKHAVTSFKAEAQSECFFCDEVLPPFWDGDSSSGFFRPDPDEITAIIEDGGIPLVSIWNCNIETFKSEPKIVRYDSERMNYVAFSHVWADGLGNPHANEMRMCQIFTVAKTLTQFLGQNFEHRLYFWMDTICVPLKPAKARNRAIQQIPDVFASARVTFVRCNELRGIRMPQAALETFSLIYASSWASRLWTYSERLFSIRLAFEIGGQWVFMQDLMKRLKEEMKTQPSSRFLTRGGDLTLTLGRDWFLDGSVLANLKPPSEVLQAPMDPAACVQKIKDSQLRSEVDLEAFSLDHIKVFTFSTIICGLPWKSTSKLFDEAICIAGLLNFDMQPLVSVSPDHSAAMKTLLQTQQYFPPEILFLDAKHRTDLGMRWAPASFLSDNVQAYELAQFKLQRSFSVLSTKGLVACMPGALLKTNQDLKFTDGGARFFFRLPPTSSAPNTAKRSQRYCLTPRCRKHVPTTIKSSESMTLALMFHSSEQLPLLNRTLLMGLLTILRKTEEDIHMVDYYCPVVLHRMDEGESNHQSGDDPDVLITCTEVLPVDQAWCVG